jgi:agmatine/peptidylarginine deiminase
MNRKRSFALPFAVLLAVGMLAQTFTSPPELPVRTMAEWEELQALVITWNPGNGGNTWRDILTEITRAAREECTVLVVCSSQSIVTAAQNYLVSKGVDLSSNVLFFIAPNNSIWVRDYGPTSVYSGDVDSLLSVDWIYNRNRPYDNIVPEKLGQLLQIPVYATTQAPYDLVNTGGNFMSDGMGTAFASKLVLRNNDQIANGEGADPNDIFGTSNHTTLEIDNILQEYMGINRYIKMDELPYDGIHHIDMHMKLLDEETLLVGEYPVGISDGPQLEANLLYVLSQFKTAFGHDFKVVRVPMPPFVGGQYPPFGGVSQYSALYPTYTNAVFVNRTVIMPKYNIPMDAAAQDTFQKYLPGYKIVPVDCNGIINSGGAVHCITKEIGVRDPLLILHSVLPCQDNSIHPAYDVYATLKHRSGIASAKVFFRTDQDSPWQSVAMEYVDMDDTAFVWKGTIPLQNPGKTVFYYLEATANSGKTFTRPITAPAGGWSFCVNQSSETTEPQEPTIAEIYPNPASGITVVPIFCPAKTQARILLCNLVGQPVATIFSGEISPGESKFFFDAGLFTPGIYFLKLQANGTELTKKVAIH